MPDSCKTTSGISCLFELVISGQRQLAAIEIMLCCLSIAQIFYNSHILTKFSSLEAPGCTAGMAIPSFQHSRRINLIDKILMHL